jgi:hypothetical protein
MSCFFFRNDTEEFAEDEYWANVYGDFIDNPREPVSDVAYPIIDEIDRINLFPENGDITNLNVVGNIGTTFYWRDLISNVLPSDRVIVVVVENTCNGAFTYQIA